MSSWEGIQRMSSSELGVAAVLAQGEPLEGERPPAAVATQALEALPVVGVDVCVRM
jgi:hypothetical protein